MRQQTKKFLIVLLGVSFISGCATSPRRRFLLGTAIGGGSGAIGGAVFSPNSESRSLNALIFGLVGAVAGGVLGLLIHDDSEIPDAKKSGENAVQPELKAREFSVEQAGEALPAFVRERLKPVLVEELREPDTVSEDGSLHEPHKVYRIKRQAELIAKPIAASKDGARE